MSINYCIANTPYLFCGVSSILKHVINQTYINRDSTDSVMVNRDIVNTKRRVRVDVSSNDDTRLKQYVQIFFSPFYNFDNNITIASNASLN